MFYILYSIYASRLKTSETRIAELDQEIEKLHVHLDLSISKEQKACKDAEQVRESKQQLLSVISHEIRTPMNGVMGMSLLLSDTFLTKEQEEYVNSIKNCGETLLTTINNLLVNDILDFSKLQQEGGQLQYKNFDVRDSVEEALTLLAGKASDAGIDLVLDIEENVPAVIIGDSKRLRQIVMNLVENAVKFTRKGEVLVRVYRTLSSVPGYPPELNFEIRDTGSGIAKDQLSLLFKGIPGKEYQKRNEKEAPGLGLVVCKKLVDMMGGHIEAESELGAGSRFSFGFPITPSMKSKREHAQQNNMMNLEGKRILIVDDNSVQLNVLTKQLTSWKMLPVAAESGKEAITILSKETFDIVLTDMNMPETDGIHLAKSVREKYPSLPVLGMNYPNDERHKQEAGLFTAVFLKPVRQHIIRDQILGALSHTTGDKHNNTAPMSDEFSNKYPLRILIAEDNLINQKIAVKILAKLGYKPELANNGKEVMEMVSHEHYDIILMDVQMPELNGLEATRMIRTCLEIQPVIIAMTANAMQGDRDECIQSGMDDYMSKPIELNELLSQLEKWSLVIKERRKLSA
jgi:signal transduction histidine kinase/CheY-like chemotaxis protein